MRKGHTRLQVNIQLYFYIVFHIHTSAIIQFFILSIIIFQQQTQRAQHDLHWSYCKRSFPRHSQLKTLSRSICTNCGIMLQTWIWLKDMSWKKVTCQTSAFPHSWIHFYKDFTSSKFLSACIKQQPVFSICVRNRRPHRGLKGLSENIYKKLSNFFSIA